MSAVQRIAEIEAEMARTQKNKATARHLGILKAKLAKLKAEVLLGDKTGSGGGAGAAGFDVTKSGDTRVGLVGFPSVGKSTLLTVLTGTFSEVAGYEFTTLTAIPGVINYRGAKIQLVDLPGIIEGAVDGKGRGRQVIGTARTCNLILMVLDAAKPMTHKRLLEKELYSFGIRLNAREPNMTFRKKDKGGVTFINQMKDKPTHLDQETVVSILKEYRINNADIIIREDVTVDEFIDVVMGNAVRIPCVYVLNKIDSISMQELEIIHQTPHCVPISAKDRWNLDDLLEEMWAKLNLTRVYTKPKGQIPDYNAPVILRQKEPTIGDFCDRVHRTFRNQFKNAWVWGTSVKHQPQRVGLQHLLHDEDVVQIVKKG
jgi:small GTP-binding protein